MHLVAFDLDKTLLAVNSSFCFGRYLYQQNLFSFGTLLLCLTDYARHKWCGMSIQDLHLKSFKRLFKGRFLSDIRLHVDNFLTQNLIKMLYEPVKQRLKEAQDCGHEVIILSSSPDFLVKEIARRLEVSNWKATTYQVDEEGRFIGISHLLEGKGKADHLRELSLQMNIPLTSTTVYSDSYLDLPVLNLAGEAIAVAPDFRLKRICLQKGWEIL